jgi:predicted RNase H-like nuclease (RuvC/YqgF family)
VIEKLNYFNLNREEKIHTNELKRMCMDFASGKDESITKREINEKFNEVNSLEKSLSSTKALNQQLSTDIESKTDLNYIEKYAKYQLGMQKPSEGQIVRIAYEKHDKISTPVVIEEVQENSFLDNLLNDLKNLID